MRRTRPLDENDRPHGPLLFMTVGALGVVFGAIGTSPLYSLQTVFASGVVKTDREDVFGVVSMVIWTITLIVSSKYVFLVMRADNEGEGGIRALVHLLRDRLSNSRRLAGVALAMGMVGAALFYGDSVITPAISVMSAFEGLVVVNKTFETLVLPASLVALTGLFLIQRWGTAIVGKLFGPVMTAWFVVIGAIGVPWIVQNPEILWAISPHYALAFVVTRPLIAVVALGAVALTITGAEAGTTWPRTTRSMASGRTSVPLAPSPGASVGEPTLSALRVPAKPVRSRRCPATVMPLDGGRARSPDSRTLAFAFDGKCSKARPFPSVG